MVQSSLGKIGGTFGIGLGIGTLIEAGKKAVTVFATVDEQARALAVSTGRSKEAIAEFYERVEQVAGAAAIDADRLRDSFNDLARAIGPEAAAAALPRLAMAAKAMNAPIADVVSLTEQMNDNLDISADKAPAAFDMIQKGTEGTRTTAAGATKGLADLSLQMRGLGESGEKGLRSTLGLLVAIGKHAPSTEAAVASLQSLMNKVGTRKTDESLEKLGRVPMRAALDEAKRKHQDEFLVFLNEVDKGLTNMATEAGTPITSKMQYLQTLIKSPEDRQAIQSILEGMPEYRAIRDRKPAEEAGATDKAFETMRPSAASFLTKLANDWNEVFQAGGRTIWGTKQHQSTDAEKRPDLARKGLLPGQSPTGGATLNSITSAPKSTSWGEWFSQFNPISPAGAAEAQHGGFPAMPSAVRPLIPSEPGSATERTAREQLEAIRRLERAALWNGGAGVGGGGFGAGEATASGGHGGVRRAAFGHPGKGSRSFRNNNPGNIKFGPFAKEHGATGADSGGFAIFPTEAAGTSAHRALWESSGYANTPLSQALPKWSGSGYTAEQLGFSGSQTFAGLGEGDKTRLLSAQRQREGWVAGGATTGSTVPGSGAPGSSVASAETMAGKNLSSLDLQTYLATGHHPNKAKEAWCAEFVGAALHHSGHSSPASNVATSYLNYGTHVNPADAKAGDVMVIPGRHRAGETGGHVGLVTGPASQGRIPTIEGNAGHQVRNRTQPLGRVEIRRPPEEHSQLEDFRRKAAEPLHVKVAYDYEDVRGIRDRGEAQGRRVFNREAKRSRYLSFSDVGVV